MVHTPGKILAKRGQKQMGKITSGEKGQTTTALCAMNASGTYLPPMLIFRRQRFTELLLKGSPPGTIGAVSSNGWIDSELFLKWLNHFVMFTKPSPQQKVILIVDGHASHKSLDVVEYASEQGVVMISLPPHTTHRMQPLDKTFFGPLKGAYNKVCDQWMLSHLGQRITCYDQAGLFGAAYNTVASVGKAVSGFQSTGIWPPNEDIFTDDYFAPSLMTQNEDQVQHESNEASTNAANKPQTSTNLVCVNETVREQPSEIMKHRKTIR